MDMVINFINELLKFLFMLDFDLSLYTSLQLLGTKLLALSLKIYFVVCCLPETGIYEHV